MRRMTRTLVFGVLLFTLLGFASFWFYHSPSQVELRLKSIIGSTLTVPVGLEACRSDPLGAGLQVAVVRVPAAPPLAARTLLTLEDLRLEGSRGTPFRRGLRPDPSPAALELTRLRVGKARLILEHEHHSSPLDSRVGRWNFESLFRPGTSPADFGQAPARILLDEMVVLLRRLETGAQPLEWELGFESVDVRPSSPPPESPESLDASGGVTPEVGLLLEGDLTEGEFWAGGQLRIEMLADGVVEVSGRIDDFRLLPKHLRLVPQEWRRLCADLDPAGTVDLTVETLRLSSREGAKVRVLAHHYDSAMRLGPDGARLKHLSGVIAITEAGVRFGQFAELEPLEAELWGLAIRLHGLSSTEQQRLIVQLPETNLRDVEFAAGRRSVGQRSAPMNLTRLTDSLGPTGSIQGEITGDLVTGRGNKWRGKLAFKDFTFQGWPWIYGGVGHIDVTVTEDARGGARSGVLNFERLGFARIGVLAGEVTWLWSDDGVSFASTGLRVVEEKAARDDGKDRVAHLDGTGADGTIFGTLAWSWEKGVTDFDLRWMDLELETELFIARAFAGNIKRTGVEVGGEVECGATDIPAVLFGAEGETWTFERGGGRILLEDGNVRILGFKLLGKKWSLRFQGKVHVSGDLDFVAVLAPAAIYGFRVDDLDGQGPEAWKENAGSDFRTYRIRGKIDHPIVRPLGPYDPVVIR